MSQFYVGVTDGGLPPDVATSYVTDDGTATPSAHILNINGQTAGTLNVVDTHGSGNTVTIEDRTWMTQYVVDPSATVGLRGTFTAIQAAITAASAPANIYIRTGTYAENLTLKSGVNLIGFSDSSNGITQITGTLTLTSGRCLIQNLFLRDPASYILVISNAATVTLQSCAILASTGNMASLDTGRLNIYNCIATLSTNHAAFVAINTSNVIVNNSNFSATDGVSTFAGGSGLTMRNVNFGQQITSSSSSAINCYNCNFGSQANSNNCITCSGSSVTNYFANCSFQCTTASAIISTSPSSITLSGCTIDSSNANAISGTGAVIYAGISFVNTSSNISTTTQSPGTISNDRKTVVTPGAYPYTTIAQDNLILVDTTSARTIVPRASPATGQKHIIKDSVGSAGTNNITVTPSGKNIEGQASFIMNINYQSITIVYNGTEWSVI